MPYRCTKPLACCLTQLGGTAAFICDRRIVFHPLTGTISSDELEDLVTSQKTEKTQKHIPYSHTEVICSMVNFRGISNRYVNMRSKHRKYEPSCVYLSPHTYCTLPNVNHVESETHQPDHNRLSYPLQTSRGIITSDWGYYLVEFHCIPRLAKPNLLQL